MTNICVGSKTGKTKETGDFCSHYKEKEIKLDKNDLDD